VLDDPSGSYIVMELVEGRTLQAAILEQGRLDLPDTIAIVSQVADALDHAHAQGVVHRDVKPANVMIEPSGHIKVMDFGIAKLESGANLTTSGLILGTPNYMAPEQARGGSVDGRADVFSLGCILYECLTGQKPFRGESVGPILVKILTEEPASLAAARPDLPPAVADVVRRAMAKEPGRRFTTGGELIAALRSAGGIPATVGLASSIARGQPPDDVVGELDLVPEVDGERTARSVPPPVTASGPPARRSTELLAVAAVVLLLVATGVLFATGGFTPTPEPGADPNALVQREHVGLIGRLLGRQPRLLVRVPAGSSLSFSLTTPLTSETASGGDRFEGVVSEDLRVEQTVAIPAGTAALGHVSRAQPSEKASGRGEITLELDRLRLEDGQVLDVVAEPRLFRGRSGIKKDGITGALAEIGATVGGLFGGKKGAGSGTAGAKGEEAELAPGTTLSFELTEGVRVTRPGEP